MQRLRPADADLPFDPGLPPERAFAHEGWVEARRAALRALAAGARVALVGEGGTGKTLLLRELARTLGNGGIRVRLSERGDTAAPAGPGTAHLVDEADALDDNALARIATEGLTVLALLPRSVPRLDALPVRFEIVPLRPMRAEEVGGFISAALRDAGLPSDLFTRAALDRLFALSSGLPRLVVTLGRAAVFQARLEGAARVEAAHVNAAETMRSGTEPEPPPAPMAPRPAETKRRLQPALLTLPVLAVAGLGALWLAQPRSTIHPEATGAPAAIAPVDSVAPAAPEVAPQPAATSATPRAEAAAPELGTFRGVTFNETLGRGGTLRLTINRVGTGDTVVAWFEAGGGLAGSGQLAGSLSADGRLVVSGTLLIGRNSFAAELEGILAGDLLTGTARYDRVVEPGVRPSFSRGSFRLTKSE